MSPQTNVIKTFALVSIRRGPPRERTTSRVNLHQDGPPRPIPHGRSRRRNSPRAHRSPGLHRTRCRSHGPWPSWLRNRRQRQKRLRLHRRTRMDGRRRSRLLESQSSRPHVCQCARRALLSCPRREGDGVGTRGSHPGPDQPGRRRCPRQKRAASHGARSHVLHDGQARLRWRCRSPLACSPHVFLTRTPIRQSGVPTCPALP